jgi:hypothetical protein
MIFFLSTFWASTRNVHSTENVLNGCRTGLPDYSWYNVPKKRENTPKDHKIYQMFVAIKYKKISTSRPSKCIKIGIFGMKISIPSGNPVCRMYVCRKKRNLLHVVRKESDFVSGNFSVFFSLSHPRISIQGRAMIMILLFLLWMSFVFFSSLDVAQKTQKCPLSNSGNSHFFCFYTYIRNICTHVHAYIIYTIHVCKTYMHMCWYKCYMSFETRFSPGVDLIKLRLGQRIFGQIFLQ